MSKGSVTRAAPLPAADRTWRIKILTMQVLMFAGLLATLLVLYTALHTNRSIGNGNRVVQCVTLAQVAPNLHLPECRGVR